MAHVLEVDDDVELGLRRRLGNARFQLGGVEPVQRPFQIHKERRQLLVLARLDAEELVHLTGHLLEGQQRVGDRIFHLHGRQLGLQGLDDGGDRRQAPLRAGPVDDPAELPVHLEARNDALAGVGDPLPDVRQRVELMLRPVEALLELLGRHAGRAERHVLPVVVRPVPVEDPACRLVPGLQRGPRQRRQDVEIRQLAMVLDQEFDRALEDRFVVVVEAEDDPGVHHDPVVVEHPDLFLELLDLVEGLVRLAQALLEDGLQSHEDRHAAALRRQLDHLRIIAQEQRGLAAPLDVQRLQGRPQLPAIGPVAVVQIVDEREDGAVLDPEPDFRGDLEGLQHRAAPHPPHQFLAHPALDPLDLGHDLGDRPPPRALAVERRHAAELAVEMATARGERALPRHVGVLAEQIHPRRLVMVQRRELLHLVMPLHAPLLEVLHQPWPGLLGLARHDGVAVPQSLVGAIGGMHAAQHDRHAPLPKLVGELVGAGRIAGHHRNPDHVRRVVEVDLADGLVLDLDIPMLRRVGGDRGQTEFGKPDRLPLAGPEMIRTLPGIGIHQQQLSLLARTGQLYELHDVTSSIKKECLAYSCKLELDRSCFPGGTSSGGIGAVFLPHATIISPVSNTMPASVATLIARRAALSGEP